MTKGILAQSVIEKIQREIEEYKDQLVNEPKKVIMYASYQTCVRDEIGNIVKEHVYYMNRDELRALYKTNGIIDQIYFDWLKFDSRFSNELLMSTFMSIDKLTGNSERNEREL